MNYKNTSYLLGNIQAIFTALILTTSISVIAAQNGWRKITDQEAGFTISFPAHPIYGRSTDPETGHPLETYSFYYNGNTLHIAFGPITPAPKTIMQVNKVLSDTANVYARNAGSLLRQEKLPGGGLQFNNLVKTPSGTMHLRSRVYVHRGRLFTLSCGSYASSGIDEHVAELFFSSFNFIDSSASQRITTGRAGPSKTLPNKRAASRWYKLRAPDGDFLADFPGKPDYSVDTSSGIPLYQYRFAHGENFFSISYRERYEPKASPEQELKLALKNYYDALSRWELLRQVEMPDGYLIEHRGTSAGYPVLARTRLHLRGMRLYYVMVMTKNLTGPNKSDATRFFESFRFL